jgi:hypothetical protein
MGKSFKGTPGPGKDWWGKRPLAGTPVSRRGMRWWKRQLHKIERQEMKRHLRRD